MSVKFFGQFLLERAVLTGEQLAAAVERQEQTNLKLGALAVELGYMSREEAERINKLQRSQDQRFGDLALAHTSLTPDQLNQLLEKQKKGRIYLGEAAHLCGFVTREQLTSELAAFGAYQQANRLPKDISEIYQGEPNAQVLEVVTDLCVKLLQRVGDLMVKAGRCHHDLATLPHSIVAAQPFTGAFRGALCLSLDEATVVQLASKMIGEPCAALDADARDALGEFLNMVSGNICGKLSGLGRACEISAPTVCDRRSERCDLLEGAAEATVTITPLALPTAQIDLVVLDHGDDAAA